MNVRVHCLKLRSPIVERRVVGPVGGRPGVIAVGGQADFHQFVLGVDPVWLPGVDQKGLAARIGRVELGPVRRLGPDHDRDEIHAEAFGPLRVHAFPGGHGTRQEPPLRRGLQGLEDVVVIVQVRIGLETGRHGLDAARGVTLNDVARHVPSARPDDTHTAQHLDLAVAAVLLEVFFLGGVVGRPTFAGEVEFSGDDRLENLGARGQEDPLHLVVHFVFENDLDELAGHQIAGPVALVKLEDALGGLADRRYRRHRHHDRRDERPLTQSIDYCHSNFLP